MSRILITGAADGLGLMAGAENTVSADLSSIKETMALAEKVNKLGEFDAIIHNAGMGYRELRRGNSVDGLPPLLAVNTLAPYILTSLIRLPKRLIYLSSGLHQDGDATLKDLTWDARVWNGYQAYADTKLHNVLIAFAIARRCKKVYANALEPGWVATKMGGPGAPDDLQEAPKTQVWLATSNSAEAMVSGKYFYHKKLHDCLPAASNMVVQEKLLIACERISGVSFPLD